MGCTTAGRLLIYTLTTEKIMLAVNVIAVTTAYLHYDAPCISCFNLFVLPAACVGFSYVSTAKSTETKPKCKLLFYDMGSL